MKNFYFSYIAEVNGKHYSSWNSFRQDENLLEVIDRFQSNRNYAVLTEFTVCPSKTEAEQLTALRNQTFKTQGIYLN